MDDATLQKKALRLPSGERALLADALLRSLDDEKTREFEAGWVAEAEDRLTAFEGGQLDSSDGSGVLKSIKGKYGK